MTPRIRPYVESDTDDVFGAVRESLAELTPWMSWCHEGYAAHETRTWLEAQVLAFSAGTAFEFAIVSSDGRYLGGCGLSQVDPINRRANLGYWVRSSATRRGVATAAVGLVRDWAWANTDLIRLEIVAAVANLPSQRVAARAGALREGLLRSRLRVHGQSQDAVVFSIIRPEAGSR